MSAAQWQDSIWVWILFTGLVAVLGVAAYAQVDPAGFAHGWRTVIGLTIFQAARLMKNAPIWLWGIVVYGTILMLAIMVVYYIYRLLLWIIGLF